MKYLIFGITGQDGGYLASMLVKKGYDVIGVRRPASTDTTEKIKEVFQGKDNDFSIAICLNAAAGLIV